MPKTLKPTSLDIAQRQNTERNRRRQLAARRTYRQAKWIRLGGESLAILFALASPVVLLNRPSWGPALGAIAGGWIFVSRLALNPWQVTFQERGASIQERFDSDVFGLDQNRSLARRVSEEEIHAGSKGLEKVKNLGDWYPFPKACPWPVSVLICQRSNAVWAQRQHRSYANTLYAATASWGAMGIAMSVAQSATLGQYLTTIALPSLPAMLDAVEMAGRHRRASDSRQRLENRCRELLDEPSTVDRGHLREIQDQLYDLRAEAPLVPEWFYKLVRGRYESSMQYAATQVAMEARRGE